MALRPSTVQRVLFRVTIVATLAAAGYLFWRYETLRLPRAGCSPLLRFRPGDLLLFDRRPSAYREGDALLFEGPDGRLHLATVDRPPLRGRGAEALWVQTDAPTCPGLDSDEVGPVAIERCRGRVVLVWHAGP